MNDYNEAMIKRLYPTKEDVDSLISKCEENIESQRKFKTNDSRLCVKRLIAFLDVLKKIKKEYEDGHDKKM